MGNQSLEKTMANSKNGNKPFTSRQSSRPHAPSAGKQTEPSNTSEPNQNRRSDVSMMDVDTQPARPAETSRPRAPSSRPPRANRALSDPFGVLSAQGSLSNLNHDGNRSMAPSPPSFTVNGSFLGSAESAFRS